MFRIIVYHETFALCYVQCEILIAATENISETYQNHEN